MAAAPESIESQVFDSSLPTLTTELTETVTSVAQVCFAKRIITRQEYNSATASGLPYNKKKEKTQELLKALSSRIAVKPEAFSTFVAILQAEAAYKHLGDKLRTDVDLRKQYKAPTSKVPSERDVRNAVSRVGNWFELGDLLDMGFDILEDIVRDFDRFGTRAQRSKMVITWLRSDPEASWSKLCGALETMGERAVAQEIREKFIQEGKENDQAADEAAAREEAVREGFIRVRSRNILIMGVGGSGKSCILSVMIGEEPPEQYTSTGLCETSKRRACVRDVKSGNRVLFFDGKFSWLTGNNLLHIIACGANACLPAIRDKQKSTADVEPNSDLPDQKLSKKAPVKAINSLTDPESPAHKLALDILAKVTKLMQDPFSEPLISEVDIMHIVDSGGQLQFHELLNKFVNDINAVIFVTNINNDPESKIKDTFFVKGKPVEKPYKSQYSHEQLFKRSLQALQLHRSMPEESVEKESAKIAIVATHIDEVEDNEKESKIKDTDKWFSGVLEDAKIDHSSIIRRGDSLAGIVFPLQVNNPSFSDTNMAQKFLSHLRDDVPVKVVDIPLSRFLFEHTIREAGKETRGVVSMTECHRIALSFKIDSVDAVLQYLTRRNLIFYIPKAIPDLVFCEVQTPLSPLKQLAQYCAKVRGDPEVESVPSAGIDPGRLSELATNGIITAELLHCKEFQNQFDHMFTPKKFLKFMEYVEIIASRGIHNEYFMPCILRELSEDGLKNYHMKSSEHIEPLLLYFGDWPEAGVFCTLITALVSNYEWEPIPFQAEGTTRDCLYRNCIKLKVSDADYKLRADVTLIESFDSGYFEVHIELPAGESPESYKTLCPLVREMLLDALPDKAQPTDAFVCSLSSPSCTCPRRHAAQLTSGAKKQILQCTKEGRKEILKPNDKRLTWLGTRPQPHEPETEGASSQHEDITTAEPENIESHVFDSSLPDLATGLANSVDLIATKCFAKELIDRQTFYTATGRGLTPGDKTQELLKALSGRIAGDRQAFHDFVAILRADASYKYLGDLLGTTTHQPQPETEQVDVEVKRQRLHEPASIEQDGQGNRKRLREPEEVDDEVKRKCPDGAGNIKQTELDKLLETVDNTTTLSIDIWGEVNESMKKLRAAWFEIGVGLKVDKAFLEELDDRNLTREGALIRTLGRWLVNYDEVKLGGKPTWRMLARIAGKRQMDVAREIAHKHPTK